MTKRIRYLVIMALLIGIISMMDNPTTINAEGAYAPMPLTVKATVLMQSAKILNP